MRNRSNIVSYKDATRSAQGFFVSSNTRQNPPERENLQAQESEPELNLKAAKKKAKQKAKMERAFNKMYGEASSTAAASAGAKGVFSKLTKNPAPAQDAAGPRAAVYKAEMGSKHRKAAAMQSGKGVGGLAAILPFNLGVGGLGFGKSNMQNSKTMPLSAAYKKLTSGKKTAFNFGIAAICMAILCITMYTPAQQCYLQIRERDRLAAEYDAILERNSILENSVNNLQSNAGIEDLAHSSFGLIKDNENAGSVSGLNLKDKTRITAKIIPGSVPAPDTWYSGVLDFLFGYTG